MSFSILRLKHFDGMVRGPKNELIATVSASAVLEPHDPHAVAAAPCPASRSMVDSILARGAMGRLVLLSELEAMALDASVHQTDLTE